MFSWLIAMLSAVITILLIILIHELGHFLVARYFGVRVSRFSIGFGKAMWKRRAKDGTEYVIAMLPLGGYVKLLDEREELVPKEQLTETYNNQPLLVRMAIVIAGPLTNFLLAILTFWIVFMVGITTVKPMVGEIIDNSVASAAGLHAGDEIQKINDHKIRGWQRLFMDTIIHMGDQSPLKITTRSASTGEIQEHHLSLRNFKLKDNQPDILENLGIVPFHPPLPAIVESVQKDSPAQRAGLQADDLIIAFNHQSISDWLELSKMIEKNPNQAVTLTITRNQKKQQLLVNLSSQVAKHKVLGYLGVKVHIPKMPEAMMNHEQYNPLLAMPLAFEQTWNFLRFNAVVLYKMLRGEIALNNLGGPITIFQTAGQAAHAGIEVYLSFVAFISLTLGLVNILPIPGLDGGHFLFQIIEGIFRRPIPEAYQALLIRIGIILLIMLMVLATINDIVRLS